MNGDEVYEEVKRRMTEWHAAQDPAGRGPLSHYCLQWAAATVAVLRDRGIRSGINAGSAKWRVCEDDGVNPDHYGYEFAMDGNTRREIAQGLMPEMHCWAVVLAGDSADGRARIIDFTVGFQTDRARDHGIVPDRVLPDYLWFAVESPPPDCYYAPSLDATFLAHYFLRSGGAV